MHRARISIRPVTPILAAVALLLAAAMPVGAGTCSLQATVGGGSATEVEVGEQVLIEGFGFPEGDVTVSYSVEGTALGDETVTADASGLFETTVIPQAGEEGLWTVTATDVADLCTAETGFLVVAGSATPSPTPSPAVGELPDVAVPAFGDGSVAWVLGAALLVVVALSVHRLRLARRMR